MNYHAIPRANQSNMLKSMPKRRRTDDQYRFPFVSIFTGFDPKMGNKNKIRLSLIKAADIAASELRDKFPGEMSVLVLQKLKNIIRDLDYSTHKKSLAIFVSPIFEKTFYFNMEVKERVSVKDSFQMSDLVDSKRESAEFHLLLLGEKESRIFLNDANSFVRIVPERAISEKIVEGDSIRLGDYSKRVAPGKDLVHEKYLQKIAHTLSTLTKSSRFPVFVMGSREMLDEFKDMPQNREAIVGYVPGGDEKSSLEELKELLDPYIKNWEKIKEKYLVGRLKETANRNKLVYGIEQVWQEVISNRGGQLLLEKGYPYEIDQWDSQIEDHELTGLYNKFSCIKNPIDKMIARVLESGGDVEFVNNGLLKNYHQIAFLKDY